MSRLFSAMAPALAGLAALICAPPASAAQCGPLRLVNTLPLQLDRGGRPLIPVTIGGKPKFLLFDTAGTVSTVKKAVVDEFKLTPQRETGVVRVNAHRDKLDRRVSIPTLAIGRLRGGAWSFAVEPDGFDYSDEKATAGTLAPDNFRQFDIDLDFAARKINLFSADHCEGKVLYWQPKALAVVPMQITNSGHVFMRVMLDGKRMDALLDTGADRSVMSIAAARKVFGLEIPAKAGPALRHRFKTLTFESIVLPNPAVELVPAITKETMPFNPGSTPTPDEQPGVPDLVIGQSVLAKLHIYIAIRERKLYVTDGDTAASALPQPK
jgi:aspartyl protease